MEHHLQETERLQVLHCTSVPMVTYYSDTRGGFVVIYTSSLSKWEEKEPLENKYSFKRIATKIILCY